MEKLRLGIGWRVTYLQSIVGSTEKDKKMLREMPLIFPHTISAGQFCLLAFCLVCKCEVVFKEFSVIGKNNINFFYS